MTTEAERASFEKWAIREGYSDFRPSIMTGQYADPYLGNAWTGWLARATARAPQPEPVAWLYQARKPGQRSEFASVSDHDTLHWPYDSNGWVEETRTPLGIIGEPVVTWPTATLSAQEPQP